MRRQFVRRRSPDQHSPSASPIAGLSETAHPRSMRLPEGAPDFATELEAGLRLAEYPELAVVPWDVVDMR